MLAIIDPQTQCVWSLHSTLANLESGLGRFMLARQFVINSGETPQVTPVAVELHTHRSVGNVCNPQEYTVLQDFTTRRKKADAPQQRFIPW